MGKIITVLGLCFMISNPTMAYLNQEYVGDAEASAGEQNTNLYKLNAVGSVNVKKLKKIDEVIARNPNNINIENYSDLNILLDDTKAREEKFLKKLAKEISDELKKKEPLTVKNNEIYHKFSELNANSVKDKTFAQQMLQSGRIK